MFPLHPENGVRALNHVLMEYINNIDVTQRITGPLKWDKCMRFIVYVSFSCRKKGDKGDIVLVGTVISRLLSMKIW